MNFEEFSIHVNGAIASLKQIEKLVEKVETDVWPAEDKRMLEHHQRVLATSLGVLDPLLTQHTQRTAYKVGGLECDLFTVVLEVVEKRYLDFVREAIAKLRSLKGKIEPLAAAAPETPIERLGSLPTGTPRSGQMTLRDFKKHVVEAITCFEGIHAITLKSWRSEIPDEKQNELRNYQARAAAAVAALDSVLTRFATRKTQFGGGMKETDMFLAAVKVSDVRGITGVGMAGEILEWVIGELRMMLAKVQALAGDSPDAVVDTLGKSGDQETSGQSNDSNAKRHELVTEFTTIRSRIKSQFSQDWYFADVDNDLREIAACMESDCYRAALSLAGRTLELILKIHCQNHNVTFDEKHSAGQLIGVIRDSKLYVDPGLKNILDLINQQRILGVHAKTGIPIPSRSQANMVCHALLDVLKRVFKLADEPK